MKEVENLIKKLLVLAVALIIAAMMSVPSFAQLLPEDQSSVTDPVASGQPATISDESVPADTSSLEVLPPDPASLCPSVTNPLVIDTMQQLMPELVQTCLDGSVEPVPVETVPAEPVSVETSPEDTAL